MKRQREKLVKRHGSGYSRPGRTFNMDSYKPIHGNGAIYLGDLYDVGNSCAPTHRGSVVFIYSGAVVADLLLIAGRQSSKTQWPSMRHGPLKPVTTDDSVTRSHNCTTHRRGNWTHSQAATLPAELELFTVACSTQKNCDR